MLTSYSGWRRNFPFPSNRQRQSFDDRLEVKRENNQNCSVLCCVRHFCTMTCPNVNSSEICVLVRFRFYFYVCLSSFFTTKPRDWLGRTTLKWPFLCRVGCKTLTLSVSDGEIEVSGCHWIWTLKVIFKV